MISNYPPPTHLGRSNGSLHKTPNKIIVLVLLLLCMQPAFGQINATFVGQAPTCPQGNDGSLCFPSTKGGIPPVSYKQTKLPTNLRDLK